MKKLGRWVVWVLVVWALVGCAPVAPTVSPVITPGISPVATPVGAAVVMPGALADGGDPPVVALSGAGIAAVTAVLTSVALAYIPGLARWWESFPNKREGMGLAGLVAAAAMIALHYAGAVDLGLGPFGWTVIWQAVEAWLAFSGAGQLAFTAQRAGRSQ